MNAYIDGNLKGAINRETVLEGLSPLNAGMMLEKRWEEIHKNKSL